MNDQQRQFVAEYLTDFNGTAAAIRAGYSPRSAGSTASKLLANPEIRAALDEHHASLATEARITVASLLEEAEAARRVAEGAENASAMVAASTFKAKLLGFMVDTPDDVAARDRALSEREQGAELKTAAVLLSEAAVSLGLPPDASPAQIVGAVAERPIATPEAFALLREV